MVIEVTTGPALFWLVISFLITAGGITYCIAYLNKGDNT